MSEPDISDEDFEISDNEYIDNQSKLSGISHSENIETVIDTDYNFWWKIGDTQSPIGYARRTEADKAAIIEAFKLLNEKL